MQGLLLNQIIWLRVFRDRFQISKKIFGVRFQILLYGFESSIFENLTPKSSIFDQKTVLKLQIHNFFFKNRKTCAKIRSVFYLEDGRRMTEEKYKLESGCRGLLPIVW
jgi:hypothetical protein